ncbi:MAG: hypothetical protein IK955_09680 [Clostridia bacterium]|nr:hypothetical protein [Clostridia bacterium]
MKKINSIRLMFTFAGCFLGAGYVSGQELWQFFGSFGKIGLIGMAVSAILLSAFGIILTRYVQLTGISDMDKVVIKKDNKILRGVFVALEVFFLFGVFVIMTAGVGAMLNQVFGLNPLIGSAVFTVCVALTAICGMSGMVTAFSVTVPLLVIMSAVIFAVSGYKNGFSDIDFSISTNENPLLQNGFISAIVFVSYNLFASIGILTPIGKAVQKKSTLYAGIIGGGLLLLIIALGIMLTMALNPESVSAQLPMLFAAQSINPVFTFIFAFLLFGGMFGTSVSSVFAIDEFVKSRFKANKKASVILIVIICLLSFVGSIFGFDKLIGIVYPVCGYLGVAALVLIVANFVKVKIQLKN